MKKASEKDCNGFGEAEKVKRGRGGIGREAEEDEVNEMRKDEGKKEGKE